MTLRIRVTWHNAGKPLLPDARADVQLVADGASLPVAHASAGLREFQVPSGAASVELSARFSVAFEGSGGAPAMSSEVLAVQQRYDLAPGGRALKPADDPAYAGPHPLVATGAPDKTGVVPIQIATDFVDITPLWFAYADHVEEYKREHQPGTELVALGFTGGDPKIWFASVPSACEAPPTDAVSAIVFFRPESYAYSRIDQPHDMFGLNRYLLKPSSDPDAAFWARDVFSRNPDDGSRWFWLRCGFEDALARSQRAAVMLHPWPSGAGFGVATGRELPKLAEAALRMLWATGKIARGRGGIKLGRLGLAGFSAGGLALWTALASVRDRATHVFSFDARGTANSAAAIAAWWGGAPTRHLHMTGGHQIAANEGLRKALTRASSPAGVRFSSYPSDEKAYLPGANPRWDHACSDLDESEKAANVGSAAVWHQFAIFGGYPAEPGPDAPSFLQRFLEQSEI